MRIGNDPLIAAAVDLSSNWTSDAISLRHVALLCVQLSLTGTALNGTFKLQCCNDEGDTDAATESTASAKLVTWSDVDSSSKSISALTGASTPYWNLADCGFAWVRVVWTASSGAGSLTKAVFNSKGF